MESQMFAKWKLWHHKVCSLGWKLQKGLGMRLISLIFSLVHLKSSSNLTFCRLLPHPFIYSKMSSLYRNATMLCMYFTFLNFVSTYALQ